MSSAMAGCPMIYAMNRVSHPLMLFAVLAAWPTRPADVVASRANPSDAAAVIARFKKKDPGMGKVFSGAYGYAVFPSVAKAGLGLGSARGKGYVYERGRLVGRSTLTQVTIGLQLGGQAYSEVVFFKDKGAFDNFKKGNLKFDAQASVSGTDGACFCRPCLPQRRGDRHDGQGRPDVRGFCMYVVCSYGSETYCRRQGKSPVVTVA
jgi:hypothetical protein